MDPHVLITFSFPISEGIDLLFLRTYSDDFSLILYFFGLGFLYSFPLLQTFFCFLKLIFYWNIVDLNVVLVSAVHKVNQLYTDIYPLFF